MSSSPPVLHTKLVTLNTPTKLDVARLKVVHGMIETPITGGRYWSIHFINLCLDCFFCVKDFGILRNERRYSTTGFVCGDGFAGDLGEGIAHCFILMIKMTSDADLNRVAIKPR